MAGHDNDGFLGPLWFVRSLFVGSILLCVVAWAYNCFIHSFPRAIMIAVITFFLIGGVMRYCDLSIPYLPKGGFREIMAAFFIGMGFLIKHFHIEDVLKKQQMIPLWLLISFLILYSLYPAYPSFDPESDLLNLIVLPITSLCGYATFFVFSANLSQGKMASFMAFIGRSTWWILSLHFLCFKFSMLIEVWLFNKDFSVLSSWPVDSLDNSYFFIIHTIVGVLFPICLAWVWQKAKRELVVKSFLSVDSFCHRD